MSPDPVLGAAALPLAALGGGVETLSDDAVALAPEIASDDAVAEPGILPEDALPVVVAEDPRTQLERVNLAALQDRPNLPGGAPVQ
ncbi:MAG: hypothetical protein ACREM1_23560 [Longimicrobiales bacterium]